MTTLFPRTPRRVAYDYGYTAPAGATNRYDRTDAVLFEGWEHGHADALAARMPVTPRLVRAAAEAFAR